MPAPPQNTEISIRPKRRIKMKSSSTKNEKKRAKKIDRRIMAGIVISTIWICVLIFFILQKLSWNQFLKLPLEEINGFLSGAFSPLAIVWLIIGFFIQQGEINENAQNIKRQVEHSNLDNFLKMSEIVYKHLGVISGYLYVSCREEIQQSLKQPIDLDDIWAKSGNGDTGIFARGLVSYRFFENGNPRDMKQIFFGSQIRQSHTSNFEDVFVGLLVKAEDSDCTGSLYNALREGTIWGILYRIIKETEVEVAEGVSEKSH